MKRAVTLLLALVGLSALLGSCGGEEEEAAILAVAFRLEEGSPVMVAYIGDPAQDPFELPAGRYYIEALDGNDVLLSLGAVDIEDGDVVDFPPSFEAAGGVADPERAQPLITLASFLIDVELAKYGFLGVITGGFSESPFDPAVELDEADFWGLADMYSEIAAEEDDVLGTLDKIEGRAEVSLRTSYVASSWAAGDSLKIVRLGLLTIFAELAMYAGKLEDPGAAGEATAYLYSVAIIAAAQQTGAHTHAKRETPKKSEALLKEEKQWQEYAEWLLEEMEVSPSEARRLLETRIKSDFRKEFPDLTKEADAFTKIFVEQVAKAVPELAATPTPSPKATPSPEPTPTPAPDIGAISTHVEGTSAAWLGLGCRESEAQQAADRLTQCLTTAMEAGFSLGQAIVECPALEFEPECAAKPTETPTPEPEPTETPEPMPTETPTPEATETPTPEPEPTETPTPEAEPTETPTPEPKAIARGKVTSYLVILEIGWHEQENTVRLEYNPDGGDVSGEAHVKAERAAPAQCPDKMSKYTLDVYYEGTYHPEVYMGMAHRFVGTYSFNEELVEYVVDPHTGECKEKPSSDSGEGFPWEALLADKYVEGGNVPGEGCIHSFELTVQS